MQIERFTTIPMSVTAVQVDVYNLEDVATWCKGQVMGTKLSRIDQCIEFNRDDEELIVEVGDWVVRYTDNEFYVYSDYLFRQKFISY